MWSRVGYSPEASLAGANTEARWRDTLELVTGILTMALLKLSSQPQLRKQEEAICHEGE